MCLKARRCLKRTYMERENLLAIWILSAKMDPWCGGLEESGRSLAWTCRDFLFGRRLEYSIYTLVRLRTTCSLPTPGTYMLPSVALGRQD